MATTKTNDRIHLLLQVVEQAFSRKAWHGVTLRGALRGLDLDRALFKPQPERHSTWELILHTAYWKYIVRRRLTGDKSLVFPRSPSNWPALRERPTIRALKADIAFLQEQHDLMTKAMECFPPYRLNRRARESKWTFAEHIHGIAAHDLYHAGQIQLLKRLHADS